MPDLPTEWLEKLSDKNDRVRLDYLFKNDHPAEIMAAEPMYMDFQLNWELEKWALDTADRYQTSQEEVIEIASQLGRYLRLVYPRFVTPSVPILHAIIPVDYLAARLTSAELRSSTFLGWQNGYYAKLKTAVATKLKDAPAAKLGSLLGEEEVAPADGPQSEPNRLRQPIDDLLPRSKSRLKDYNHTQAFAGDLIHFLFDTALKRNQAPHLLLKELVHTARYLDVNFPDQKLPTLREQLLIKTMTAEKLALRLDRVVSVLETVLVDLQVSAKSFEKATLTLISA